VRTYALSKVSAPDDELIAHFVAEYYAPGSFVPEEVLLPIEIEAMNGLGDLLSEQKGRSVSLLVPKKGPRAELVDMARENASHAFREKARASQDLDERLAAVKERLRLPVLPRRIECVDVSHTGGSETVASIVALTDGKPDKKRYRSFHVKRVSGGDDYSAMYEVLLRRLRRGRSEEAGWELPDLLVVDGGRGQLNIALRALQDLGIDDLPLVALAKEKPNVLGEKLVDRVYLPNQKNPIELRENHAALGMLALARDEAHRASNALRTKLGHKRKLKSRLDEIPGIGPKTRARLLKALGSVKAIEQADALALRNAGATEAQANAILRAFHGPLTPEAAAPGRDAALPLTLESSPVPAGDEGAGEESPEVADVEEIAVRNAFADQTGGRMPDAGGAERRES
jgi:excinuclease ABC subunit C